MKQKKTLQDNFTDFIYNTKKDAYRALRVISLLCSVLCLGIIVYIYGFPLKKDQVNLMFGLLELLLFIFVLNYATRIFYTSEQKAFIKRTFIEFIITSSIILSGILSFIFDFHSLHSLGSYFGYQSRSFYEVFVTIVIMFLVLFEVSKATFIFNIISVKPTTTFLVSFVVLILGGAAGLMLPASTTMKGSMPFVDALFVSASAACVTGLSTVDPATYFTFKGHLIIMFLAQFGGIGIVTFATFFSVLLNQNVGIKHQSMLQDMLSGTSLNDARRLLRGVILLTLVIEIIGAILIFLSWGDSVKFTGFGQKVFYSIFHSISAFCNAGFALFSNNLYENGVKDAYMLHIVIAFLIIFGGIGFNTMQEFSISRLRERLHTPWKDWQTASKIVIFSTIVLITVGMIGFFLLEKENTIKQLNFMEKLITSFFQSVTTRTAGFNTVDMSKLANPTLLLMIFLMFVGASPLSTGGGVKTTTTYILIASTIANIRGKKHVTVGRRSIDDTTVSRASAVFSIAVFYNLLATFVLTILEPDMLVIQLAFEQTSAFATVGLSTGITPQLSTASKYLLIASMYLGRVGTVTLALALSTRVLSNAYEYPKDNVMVG